MGTGTALVVGVSRPDIPGWNAPFLPGVANDVRDMNAFFQARGFTVRTLRDSAAGANAVLGEIDRAATVMRSGDMFVFYFSGHGAQQRSTDGDEFQDQLLMTYGAPIVDDSLGLRWPRFVEGVRIVVITDCCNSGSNVRALVADDERLIPAGKIVNRSAIEPLEITLGLDKLAATQGRTRDGNIQGLRASLLHMAAAQDPQLAQDIGSNGLFTHAFLSAWNADYRASYDQLFNRAFNIVIARVRTQKPRMTLYGFDQVAFRRQIPFKPSLAWPPTLS